MSIMLPHYKSDLMPLRKPIFGLIALHQFLHARQQFFQTKSNVFELLYLDIFVCCESKKKKIEHDKKEMKGIIEMEMRNLMTKLFFSQYFQLHNSPTAAEFFGFAAS
jgi:hypothetical protein